MQTINLTNLANPLNLLVLNVRYVLRKYVVAYLLFTLPYSLYTVLVMHKSALTDQFFGYITLCAFFFYGLIKTKQPSYVIASGILMFCHQYDFFAGAQQHTFEITVSVLLLITLKQYQRRTYFAILVLMEDERKRKAHK